MMDNFRRMAFPSGITLVTLAYECECVAAASEMDELECGVRKACERLLNGERTLYTIGGYGDDVGERQTKLA
ncbi:hypothetical protein EDB85DRAFT_1995605 [Lactarius pseudohatsudake]|nr:hypothetical protein EDB85DRAFT_1995605 [Lactarius pseudohatsudake]